MRYLKKIIIFLVLLLSIGSMNAQSEFNVKISESEINKIINSSIAARGFNFGTYWGGIGEYWIGNIDAAHINILPNNQVDLVIDDLYFLVEIDFSVVDFTVTGHISGIINSEFILEGNEIDGYNIVLQYNSVDLYSWGDLSNIPGWLGTLFYDDKIIDELPDINISLTDLTPDFFSESFNLETPPLSSDLDNVYLNFNVIGDRYIKIANNLLVPNQQHSVTNEGDVYHFENSSFIPYPSGFEFAWDLNSTHTIKPELNGIDYSVDNKHYKYNVWEDNTTNGVRDVIVHEDIDYNANFNKSNNINFSVTYEGASGSFGTININGVNHTFPINQYIFSAPLSEPVSVDDNFSYNGSNYVFLNWSDESTDISRNLSPTIDMSLTANYKGSQMSNTENALLNTGQTKFVQSDDGTLHVVYESMGKVWYEVSTNNGNTWEIMNGGNPLSVNESKSPSILESDPYCYIVFQENSNGTAAVKVQKQNFRTNQMVVEETFNNSTNSYSFDTNPVVLTSQYDANYSVILLLYRKYSAHAFDPVEGYLASVGKMTSANDLGFDQNNLPYQVEVPNTDENSNNIDLANDWYYNHYNGNIFHLVWEQETSTTTSVLKYTQLTFNYSSNVISYYPSVPEEPSSGSGYTKNYSPSLVVLDDNLPRLTWVGEKEIVEQEEEGQRKIGSAEGSSGTIEKRVVLRGRSSTSWNSTFWKYGSDPNSVSMNSNETGTIGGYAFAWSEGSPAVTSHKSVTNTRINYSPVGICDAVGTDIHLCNGDGVNDMYTIGLDNSSLPYDIVRSENIQDLPHNCEAGLEKVSATIIQSVGREGLIKHNDEVFFFELKDIMLDDEVIEFEPLSDTTNFNDLISLNSYLESLPFEVDNSSQLAYSVKYGLVSEEEQVLEEGEFINYKVQLVDNVTREVIGTYDNITFTENNLEPYNNIDYIIMTNGIGNRMVKMRLVVDYNVEADPNLATIFSEIDLLQKNGAVTLNYNGEGEVTTYDLSQNYPNPFNPTTTIKYQIPNSGNVSLKIYDVLGAEVMTLVNTTQAQGRYEVKFDASQLSSGVYIYRIQANDYIASRKMMLLK
jgi:hypothetical protein